MVKALRPVPILTYHQIAAAPPRGAPFRSLYVSPQAFARQMALLHQLGYRGLSMTDLLPYLRGERAGKVVGVTFDDGYLNNLTHALPALQRQGFTSTCYIVSQRIGKTNTWDADNGVEQTPLMNADQIRQWCRGGQEIGCHTRTHPNLTAVAAQDSLVEIEQSRAELETLTGAAVRHFCYPFGAYAKLQLRQVIEAGYVTATTTARGRALPESSLLELPRVPVVRSTSLPVLMLKVATAYEDHRRG